MEELTFKIQRGMQISPLQTNPIDQPSLNNFKSKITKELSRYISKINACGGHVAITVDPSGKTFTYRLLEMKDHDLFAQIIDELYSK